MNRSISICHRAHRLSWNTVFMTILVCCGLLTAGGVAIGQDADANKSKEKQADPLAKLKQDIVQKNIFSPARKQARATYDADSSPLSSRDVGPRQLKRPFVVKGITQVGDKALAYLYFDDPGEYRTVKEGDIIETIEIEKIYSNYLQCKYAGREVKIAVDESSNDALARLVGLGGSSGYYLIGTTVGPNDSFALFFFPGETRPRKVRVGDRLGATRQIIKIEPGKVILLDPDGDKITVEAGPPPKR